MSRLICFTHETTSGEPAHEMFVYFTASRLRRAFAIMTRFENGLDLFDNLEILIRLLDIPLKHTIVQGFTTCVWSRE